MNRKPADEKAAPAMRYEKAELQPISVEIKMADGLFVKSMLILKAGTIVPQHAHTYEHLSMVAAGSVHAWRDGLSIGVYNAPAGIIIPAESKHTFEALVDNTLLYCIHNVSRTGEVEIADEHQLPGIDPQT